MLQANLLAKDAKDGPLLLEAAGGLPLVLMSTQGSNTEVVWRGIEVGAADVLEKPLSLLKLRNIWQHVVRKVSALQILHAYQRLSGRPALWVSDASIAVTVFGMAC